ncbi:hypothetical protein PIB30_068973 [Stylosanthes scabra]|uniref:Uncharacterized protein n=1 Tax=Stylosanthes scabra TaxID=79078 RepID=A0ABU6XPC0_9FABA|nr:hypothetical protein [Stylosanthes scabra]
MGLKSEHLPHYCNPNLRHYLSSCSVSPMAKFHPKYEAVSATLDFEDGGCWSKDWLQKGFLCSLLLSLFMHFLVSSQKGGRRVKLDARGRSFRLCYI